MDKQFERIKAIAGKDMERNDKTVIKYRIYLGKKE